MGIGLSVHGRLQNLKTSEDTFGHVIIPLTKDYQLGCMSFLIRCRFLGHENEASFFSETQRSSVCWRIIETTPYGKRTLRQMGIKPLLSDGVFTAAYPLHDVSNQNPQCSCYQSTSRICLDQCHGLQKLTY